MNLCCNKLKLKQLFLILKNSLKILNSIAKHADILELGFPHNTPIADGGQIQGSSHRALKNGIKLKDVFQIVKKFKKNTEKTQLVKSEN